VENTRVGPFQIIQKLGANRRHNVYRAVQVDQQREVVLKFIKLPPNVDKAKAISRIQRETKILKKLSHPNLVRVYGAGVEGSNIFFAMEFVRGESLSAILTRREKLAWDLALDYAKQIAMMLEYIHSHEIIHLKLTPDKILINEEGKLQVTDLRLNRSKKRRWDESSRKALDIAAYMAPEQLSGGTGTAKSDFYALGVILFEMLTGKLPYVPDTLTQMIRMKQTEPPPPISDYNMDCPVWLDRIVVHLLQNDPLRRPHSARAIVLALQEVQDIDSSGTGVAEKLVGSFNPLTIGMDKSEAKKVLGFKEEKPPGTPFYQRLSVQVSGLVIALIMIAVFVGVMLKPASDRSLYEQAARMVHSENQGDWSTAKLNYIEPLMERGTERPYYQKAEELLFEIERKRLLNRAMNGDWVRKGDTRYERRFLKAYETEDEGDYKRALTLYRQLARETDSDGDQRHIHYLANEKIEDMLAFIELTGNKSDPKTVGNGEDEPESNTNEKTGDESKDETVEEPADQFKPRREEDLGIKEATGPPDNSAVDKAAASDTE